MMILAIQQCMWPTATIHLFMEYGGWLAMERRRSQSLFQFVGMVTYLVLFVRVR